MNLLIASDTLEIAHFVEFGFFGSNSISVSDGGSRVPYVRIFCVVMYYCAEYLTMGYRAE